MTQHKKDLLLFDIDGTLTFPRQSAPEFLEKTLQEAKKYFDIAIVGGSDRIKQVEQLGDLVKMFNFAFSENGTVSYDKEGKVFHQMSINKFLGEESF